MAPSLGRLLLEGTKYKDSISPKCLPRLNKSTSPTAFGRLAIIKVQGDEEGTEVGAKEREEAILGTFVDGCVKLNELMLTANSTSNIDKIKLLDKN